MYYYEIKRQMFPQIFMTINYFEWPVVDQKTIIQNDRGTWCSDNGIIWKLFTSVKKWINDYRSDEQVTFELKGYFKCLHARLHVLYYK